MPDFEPFERVLLTIEYDGMESRYAAMGCCFDSP